MLARLFVFIAVLGFSASLEAAEIKTDGRVVWITGPFVAEDGDRFKAVALAVGDGATIVLESDGGSAGAAIAVGEEIKRRKFATAVLADKTCASACGFVWLAGKPRLMDKTAKLGFHAVYLLEEGKPVPSVAANAVMGSYLGSIGIPPTAIYFVTMAGPDGMNWMDQKIAAKLGVEVLVFDQTVTDEDEIFGRRNMVKRGGKKALLEDLFRRANEDEGAN